MELGVAIGGEFALIGGLARAAEDAGFESVWVTETARTAYVQAAVACLATSRIRIGTAAAIAFSRSPAIHAMTARDLAELSGGRFILGLGSQVRAVVEKRFGVAFDHPAPRLGEAVEAIRAVLHSFDGSSPNHRRRFYTITMAPFPGASPAPGGDVPIYVAAVKPFMARTAGRVANGLLGHPMTSPAYIRKVLRPAVDEGAAEAGRQPAEVNLTSGVFVQVSEDRDEARRRAASQVGLYGVTAGYRPILALHGFEDRAEPLRRAFVRRDMGAMVELALPMVDSLAVAGTAGECRERLRAFEDVVDRLFLYSMLEGGSGEGPASILQTIEALAPGRR